MGTVDELYQTSRDIENLLVEYFQNIDEHGMVIDENVHAKLKAELAGKEEGKHGSLLSLGHSVKRRKSEIEMILAEEKRFVSKKQRLHSEILGIENIIIQHLEIDQKLSDGLVSLKWRGEWKLICQKDAPIPVEYWDRIETPPENKLDESKLKKAIKAGKTIPGVHIDYIKKLSIS